MLQIGICDDDKIVLKKAEGCLQNLLREKSLEAEIYIFDNAKSLINHIEQEEKTLNLLFLDIVLSENAEGKNGIFVGKGINRVIPRCQIIFVTNYNEYSMDVYEVEHRGFIIKDEFEKRLNRTFELLFEQKKLLTVSVKGKQLTFAVADICYVERGRRISKIVTFDSNSEIGQVVNISFEEMCIRITGRNFIRCHNGYLVNLQEVRTYTPEGFFMSNGEFIAISRRYRNAVRDRFLEWQQEWM